MEPVSNVEENSGDGLSLVDASGFDDESTNLFPSLNELNQTYVLDSTLPNDSRSASAKRGTLSRARKKLACGSSKVQIPKARNIYYERKIRHLRRLAKELVYTNAALLDELSSCELEIARNKQERKSLLKRLFQFLPMTESQALQSSHALKSLAETFHGNIPPSILGPVPIAPTGSRPNPTQRSKKKPSKVPSKKTVGKGSAVKEK